MTSNAELACVYSALILADDDIAVTVSKKWFLNFIGYVICGKNRILFLPILVIQLFYCFVQICWMKRFVALLKYNFYNMLKMKVDITLILTAA